MTQRQPDGDARPTLLITTHAQQRLQQRGISLEIVHLIYEFGTSRWKNGELTYSFDHKARKRLDKALGDELASDLAEQASKYYIVVSPDQQPVLVTAAIQLKRRRN